MVSHTGLRFALAVDDRPLLRRFFLLSGALTMTGAVLAVARLWSRDGDNAALPSGPWSLSILAIALACIVAFAPRAARGQPAGTFEVDARGEASWRPGHALHAGAVQPLSWYRGAGMIWLQWAQPAPDGRRAIVLGRQGLTDPDWRAVCTWLVWLERGPRPQADPHTGA